jgi:hypothetical protein
VSVQKDPYEKIRLELKAMWRIHNQGIHPIDALDQLLAHAFDIARSEINNRNPHADKNEIEKELRRWVKQDFSLRNKISKKNVKVRTFYLL